MDHVLPPLSKKGKQKETQLQKATAIAAAMIP